MLVSSEHEGSARDDLTFLTPLFPPSDNEDSYYWDARRGDTVVRNQIERRSKLWASVYGGIFSESEEPISTRDVTVQALLSIRQCRVLGSPALAFLSRYIDEHNRRSGEGIGSKSRLIYSCESNKKKHFCGGMGDRFRGIVSAFYMALLTNRRFEIYSPVPVPIQKYLHPHLVNWIPSTMGEVPPRMADVHRSLSTIPSDLSMMSIKKHSSYLKRLDGMVVEGSQGESGGDLRLQTNSVGIDMFLSAQKMPSLTRRRRLMFRGDPGDPYLRRITDAFVRKGWISAEGGGELDDRSLVALNISTYFGCLYEILFAPSEELLQSAAGALNGDTQSSPFVSFHTGWFENPPSSHSLNSSVTRFAKTHGLDSLVLGGLRPNQIGGLMEPFLVLRRPYISLQVRVGGALAKGMKEPFRTPPDAFGEFYRMLSAIFQASARGYGDGWGLFVSSDAEVFINNTVLKFDRKSVDGRSGTMIDVRVVRGNEAFLHTDTLNLGDIDASRWAQTQQQTKEKAYFLTLLNNYLLGLGSHMVMAQSGFGDTAYWRMRRDASCIFVDMTNLRYAWQHHLAYARGGKDSSPNHFLSLRLHPPERYGAVAHADVVVGAQLVEARSLRNRVLDLKALPPTDFYE